MQIDVLGKVLIGIGIVTVIIGLTLFFGSKIGLGRLPGDIFIKKGSFTFYFPIITCIIISIILTIIANILFKK